MYLKGDYGKLFRMARAVSLEAQVFHKTGHTLMLAEKKFVLETVAHSMTFIAVRKMMISKHVTQSSLELAHLNIFLSNGLFLVYFSSS